jgi:hypothetical protein
MLTFAGYFLLSDSLNTTVTVIATLQNSIVAYDTLELTYLLIVGIAAQGAGMYAFWWVQKRYGLSTKTMFNAVAVGIILLDGWGMIGIWTQNFGFHHTWEVWVCSYHRHPSPELATYDHTGIPNLLRSLRLPLVLVLADHDLRGDAPRQRIPLLQPFQHHGQNLCFYWSDRVLCHHRCNSRWEQLNALLLPVCSKPGQLHLPSLLRRS